MSRARLSNSELVALYVRRSNGELTDDLAAEVGIRADSLRVAWRRVGLSPLRRGPTQTPGDLDLIRELYEEYMAGALMADVAERFGVKPAALCARWRRRGWPLRLHVRRLATYEAAAK